MPRRTRPDPVCKALGMRVGDMRRERGLSLSQLTAASEESDGHLSNIEQGLVNITIGSLFKIAKGLGAAPMDVMCIGGSELEEFVEDFRALPPKVQLGWCSRWARELGIVSQVPVGTYARNCSRQDNSVYPNGVEDPVQPSMNETGFPLRSEALSVALSGLVATLIRIVVTIEAGPSAFELIGLANGSVRETAARVLTASARLGKWFDGYKIKVEFSPAGIRNDGMLDLAIAVAVLMALENKSPPPMVFLGELGMNAAVRSVRGTLPALVGVKDIPSAIVPWGNGNEAASVQHMEVRAAAHLHEVIEHLQGTRQLTLATSFTNRVPVEAIDMVDVHGLLAGRRAVEVAAAGFHPLLLIGLPASGRTMLARRLPTVLPPLSHAEALEVTSIHSVAGLHEANQQLLTRRPLRAPLHTADRASLVGGGFPPRPGEASLAHHGVLFLDDMQMFEPRALAVLDRVLEAGESVIHERQSRVAFPARPLLVAGVLPCPCGFHGMKNRICSCALTRFRAYRERLRGPVFDRMQLHACLSGALHGPRGERSAVVRLRVVNARDAQRRRFEAGKTSELVNGRLSVGDLERVAAPDAKGAHILGRAELGPELEATVLRVARTIADLDGSAAVRAHHVEEAIALAPCMEA